MIKSFITYTPEEEAERQALYAQRKAAWDMTTEIKAETDPEKRRELSRKQGAEIDRVSRAEIRILGMARRRYIASIKGNPEAALRDLTGALAAYAKEDFLDQMGYTKSHQERYVSMMEDELKTKGISPERERALKSELSHAKKTLDRLCKRNFSSLVLWLSSLCADQLDALADDEAGTAEAVKRIRQKAAQIYKPRYGDIDLDETPQPEQLSIFDELSPLEEEAPRQDILEWLTVTSSPGRHVIPNNKLANTITNPALLDGAEHPIVVGHKGKKEVTTLCVLNYEGDNVRITGRQPFTEYDRNVYNGLCSLYAYGDHSHTFTPAMVYRATAGTDTPPSPQQIGAITRSLDKMRFIRCRINCTDELTQRGATIDGEQIKGGVYDTYLLNADAVEVTTTGDNRVKAYRVNRPPVLFDYASKVGQVLSLPSELLDIKKLDKAGRITTRSILNTESRIQIKGYLLRQVERIRGAETGANKTGNTVSFLGYRKDGEDHPGLYEIAGYKEITKDSAKNVRDYTAQVLDYWKAKGFIKSWSFTTKGKGKAVTGVKITTGGKYEG